MSTDVTSLVLEVDSRQADKATDSLERLTKAGKTLESQLDKEVTAHDRVARAAEKAVRARDNKGRFIGQQREYNRTLEDEVAKTARSNWLMEQKTAIAKRLGVALGIAASAAAGLVTYAIIRNTIEAEEGMAQLEARLRSTAGAAGISKDALVQLADNLQAVTRFEDDAIIAAEGLLLTFTKVGRDVAPGVGTSVSEFAELELPSSSEPKSGWLRFGSSGLLEQANTRPPKRIDGRPLTR